MLLDAYGHPIEDDAQTEAEILAALGAEILTLEAEAEPMIIGLHPLSAFQLAGLLQLVLRHPGLQDSNRETAQRFIQSVREYFAESPAILQVLERGDDPEQDV